MVSNCNTLFIFTINLIDGQFLYLWFKKTWSLKQMQRRVVVERQKQLIRWFIQFRDCESWMNSTIKTTCFFPLWIKIYKFSTLWRMLLMFVIFCNITINILILTYNYFNMKSLKIKTESCCISLINFRIQFKRFWDLSCQLFMLIIFNVIQ